MRFGTLHAVSAALLSASSASALNILLGNDDGFGASHVREFYRLLKKSGHTVVMVAPADNQSGMGGRSVFDPSPVLQRPTEYNLVPAGAPSLGKDPLDDHIFYYNGTPAACTFAALDYVLPTYFPDFGTPDLYVGGPNFGNNLGSFLYTLSGTIGGTYAAIGRDIPGIAFSGGNNVQQSYQNISKTTVTGLPDPATIQAQLAVSIVDQLAKTTKAGERIFPLGFGLNVNTPYITSLVNKSCVAPKFYQSKLVGGALTDKVTFVNGTFKYANFESKGINTVIFPHGNPNLPGETELLLAGCYSAVSVFTIDYDAPRGSQQGTIRQKQLAGVVKYGNPIKSSKRSISVEDTLPFH